MHPPPPPVSPDPDSGLCCKLEAKLARNGLFNKAAALVFDEVECAGYDTEGGNGLDEGAAEAAVEIGVGTFATPPLTLFSKGDVVFLLQVLLLFTVILSVTRISVDEDLDLDLLRIGDNLVLGSVDPSRMQLLGSLMDPANGEFLCLAS